MQNRGNIRQNREQMRFQERMSNTSAQRAVADYTKAGLNPALAYDRGASSPSGASATIGDAVGGGVASAMSARQVRANLELTAAQTRKTDAEAESARVDAAVKSGTLTPGEPSYRDEVMAARRDRLRGFGAGAALQPHQLRSAELANMLAASDLNRRNTMSGLWGDARTASEAFRAMVRDLPYRGAADAAKGWASAAQSRVQGVRDLPRRMATDWSKYQDSHPYIFKPRSMRK